MRRKLGLATAEDDDGELIRSLLDWMEAAQADYTNTFRDLSADGPLNSSQYQAPTFQAWHGQWRDRLQREGRQDSEVHADMRSANPAIIPRNHRVEEALAAAEEHGDLSVLQRLLVALATPFEANANSAYYREPQPDDHCYRTFCGT